MNFNEIARQQLQIAQDAMKARVNAKNTKYKPHKSLLRKSRRESSRETLLLSLIQMNQAKCPLCKKIMTEKGQHSMCLDHCHKTNKLRGLICKKCNIGLGMFDDNWRTIQRAALYMQTFESAKAPQVIENKDQTV
jgi:hypothetical protein